MRRNKVRSYKLDKQQEIQQRWHRKNTHKIFQEVDYKRENIINMYMKKSKPLFPLC